MKCWTDNHGHEDYENYSRQICHHNGFSQYFKFKQKPKFGNINILRTSHVVSMSKGWLLTKILIGIS